MTRPRAWRTPGCLACAVDGVRQDLRRAEHFDVACDISASFAKHSAVYARCSTYVNDPGSSPRQEGKRVPRTLTSTLLYTAWSGLGGRNHLKSKAKKSRALSRAKAVRRRTPNILRSLAKHFDVVRQARQCLPNDIEFLAVCLANDVKMFGVRRRVFGATKNLACIGEVLSVSRRVFDVECLASDIEMFGDGRRNVWRATSECLARRNTWRTPMTPKCLAYAAGCFAYAAECLANGVEVFGALHRNAFRDSELGVCGEVFGVRALDSTFFSSIIQ